MIESKRPWYKERNFWIMYIISMCFFIGIGYASADPANKTSNSTPLVSQNSDAETPSPTEESPQPVNLSGTGQTATDKFRLKPGLVKIKMIHSGSANFYASLLDSDGNHIESLVNEIGPFDGSKAVKIGKEGEYVLDIMADGQWTFDITY